MNTGKFLDIVAGIPTQIHALLHSTGAPDAGKIIKLDETGRISQTVLPVGIAADTESALASESLTSNDLVQIWDDGGTAKVRRAEATALNKFLAVGFVKDNFTSGQTALVYFDGRMTGMSGLTISAPYYLSETPGQATATAPVTASAVVQGIGYAVSSTTLSFEKFIPVHLAPVEP